MQWVPNYSINLWNCGMSSYSQLKYIKQHHELKKLIKSLPQVSGTGHWLLDWEPLGLHYTVFWILHLDKLVGEILKIAG